MNDVCYPTDLRLTQRSEFDLAASTNPFNDGVLRASRDGRLARGIRLRWWCWFPLRLLAIVCFLLPTGAVDLTLAWDSNTEPDLAGYRLYQGTSSQQYDGSTDVGNITTAVVSRLQPGSTYWFVLTAYNTRGLESEPSNEVNYTVPAPPPTAAVLLSFSARWDGPHQITVTWQTGVEVDLIAFRLERRLDDGGWTSVLPEIIPASGGGRPETYQILDLEVPAARQVRYRLLGVDLRGRSTVLAETAVREALQLNIAHTQAILRLSANLDSGGRAVLETRTNLARGSWAPVKEFDGDSLNWDVPVPPSPGSDPTCFFRIRKLAGGDPVPVGVVSESGDPIAGGLGGIGQMPVAPGDRQPQDELHPLPIPAVQLRGASHRSIRTLRLR